MTMKYKYVCEVTFPVYEVTIDINIPINKSVLYTCKMLDKIIQEEIDPNYVPKDNSILINKVNGNAFDKNDLVVDSEICNGTKLCYY